MKKTGLIAKMDEFVRLGNEIDRAIKQQYGSQAWLFHEADGTMYAMSGDATDGSISARKKFIKAQSDEIVKWGAGAW